VARVADRVLYSTAAGIYAISICVLFTIKLDPAAAKPSTDPNGDGSGGDGTGGSKSAYTRRLAAERFADYRSSSSSSSGRSGRQRQQVAEEYDTQAKYARYGGL
jgi:hypothetical protein